MCKGEMHDASGMVREEITKILSDSALAGKTTRFGGFNNGYRMRILRKD